MVIKTRIKTQIEDLELELHSQGKKPAKVAQRLIEAGLGILEDCGALSPSTRIVPNYDVGGDFEDSYHTVTFTPSDIIDAEDPSNTLESFQEATVQADSPLQALGGARIVLTTVYAHEDAARPLLGIRFHVEDRPILDTLVELGFVTRDEVSDVVLLSTKGREAIGLRPAGLPALPVEVAEITGNIAEAELAGRYIDGKIAGCERYIREGTLPENVENLRYVAAVLGEIAHEFRIGMHLPVVQIEGRVIPYNEDRTSGLLHADNLQLFFDDVYARNLKAGWWTDIETGKPKKRNVGELFILMVTELAEAYKAYVNNEADDKLPQHPGVGVEMGDLIIRVADFCGAVAAGNVVEYSPTTNPGEQMFAEIVEIAERYEAIRKTPAAKGETEPGDFIPTMLVGPMIDDKLLYNSTRKDHRIEERLKEDGKRT